MATAGLVFVLLVLIYRSPVFWLIPLLAVLFAEAVVRGLGTLLAEAGVVINGQTGGILLVLVFGAGTDYALLLTARYREELVRHRDRTTRWRSPSALSWPAIFASAGTVILGMLCLLVAEMNSTQSLGPVAAIGIGVAFPRDDHAVARDLGHLRPLVVLAVRAPVRPHTRTTTR
jgi:RND superfamily putative drug exporter